MSKIKSVNQGEVKEELPTLYGYDGALTKVFFKTEEELRNWCSNNKHYPARLCKVEYNGFYNGKNDVMTFYYFNNVTMIKAIPQVFDIHGYLIYELNKWTYTEDEEALKDVYYAFKNQGVEFKSNIYSEWDYIVNYADELINGNSEVIDPFDLQKTKTKTKSDNA